VARIEHFAIFADDLETVRMFYQRHFGLSVAVDNSRAPVRGYFLADDRGTAIEIIERPPGVARGDTRYLCHTAILVDDVESARAQLEAEGVTFETDTVVETDNFKTAFFRDPDGNRCQIVWRAEPLVPGH
jgi:glyoxylase I family protein